jgi:ribosomal protein L29
MKYKELAAMDREERSKKMKELELEIIKLNSQVHTGTPPKNSGQLRKMKKDLARIMLISSTDKENKPIKSRTKKATKTK